MDGDCVVDYHLLAGVCPASFAERGIISCWMLGYTERLRETGSVCLHSAPLCPHARDSKTLDIQDLECFVGDLSDFQLSERTVVQYNSDGGSAKRARAASVCALTHLSMNVVGTISRCCLSDE